MKEILIRRDKENANELVNYKVIIDNRETILIGNGETKKVLLDIVPVNVYAKLNWLKSKEVTVDSNTLELILKREKMKNWFPPRLRGLFILVILIPRMIWHNSQLATTFIVIGLSIFFFLTSYAFIIKRTVLVIIDKKTVE